MPAVKPTSMISGKAWMSLSVTMEPSMVSKKPRGCGTKLSGSRMGLLVAAAGGGRADGLVGFLGALVGRSEEVGLFGEVFGAELLLNERTGHGEGLGAEVRRVGTHVGDVAGLVERLGDAHGALGAETEAAGGAL